jgi:hypothetical protein
MMPLQHAALTLAALPPPAAIATKLRLGPVNDPLEREADRVADAVVAGQPAGVIGQGAPSVAHRKCAECAAEDDRTLHRHEGHASHTPSYAPATAIAALAHGGQSLTAEQRAYFEPRFGQQFSHVRLHADDRAARAAQDVNALAFTVGHDIAFAAGQLAPDTHAGRRLIAHELAHVVQGAHGTLQRQPAPAAQQTPQPASQGPGAPYRLELANPLSDVEAHASLYELLPALVARITKAHNIDEKLAWRLAEWALSGLGFMTEMTYSHEQGGHGGAARRFGFDPEVTLKAPWSGSTCPVPLVNGQCFAPPGLTAEQDLNITAAGVNQQTINASRMASRWALRGSISYQEAMAYLYAKTNLAAYAARTFLLSKTASEDDIYKYATTQGSLSPGELMGLAAVADLLSGPAWAALIGQWNYLLHGDRQVSIPTFKIGREIRATLPNFQVLLSKHGPLLGGRSTLNVGGRFPLEVSIDASLDEPGIAAGAQLYAPLTPKLTLSPFGRFSYSQSEGAGGQLGLEAQYKLTPWLGISATLSYRKQDLLTGAEGASEGLQGRGAMTLEF